jgi:AraC family transcriptional regulator, dual regulator of chb operon
MQKIFLEPLLVPGDACHVALSTVSGTNFPQLHTHDFLEIFVIVQGMGTHFINGKRLPLKTGDLVFIRPQDGHNFGTPVGKEMRLLNVAFLASWFEHFRSILPREKVMARWVKSKMPPTVHLSQGTREALERLGDELILSKSPRHFGLAQFCLEAFAVLESPHLSTNDLLAPEWLTRAVAAMDLPENLASEIIFFQKIAGRSPEHFARMCHHHFGMPPTELLNQSRVRHAKRRLLESDAKVIDIAYDCGFQNIGYFHRVFLRLSGLTPRTWRFKHRPITVFG